MIEFLHTYQPSPILLQVGPVTLYWYGFFYALSITLGYWLVRSTLRRYSRAVKSDPLQASSFKLQAHHLPDLTFGLIIAGLLGARLYHVANEWRYYWQYPGQIVAVWNGGLAIHGAIIAALIFLWFYTKKMRGQELLDFPRRRKIGPDPIFHKTAVASSKIVPVPFFFLLDLLAPAVLLGQAIGRWGNYFNQELFGYPTSLPWSIPIDLGHRPPGYEAFEYFHPTFLYESLWDFVGFILLLIWQKRRPEKIGRGHTFVLYILLTSVGRIVVENFRIDPVPTVFGWRLPMVISLLLLAGVVFTATSLVIRRRSALYS